MLSARPWKPEAVIRLFLALFLGLALVGLAGALVNQWGQSVSPLTRLLAFELGGTMVFQVAALVLVSWFLRESQMTWGSAFGITRRGVGRAVAFGAWAGVLVFPLNAGLLWISQRFLEWVGVTPEVQATVEAVRNVEPTGLKLLVALMPVVMAPLVEEVLFRGILYPTIKQAGFPRIALWGTAVLFAMAHANLMTFLPLFCFALVLTFLYERTDNLLTPIVTHSLFNAANFLWLLLDPRA